MATRGGDVDMADAPVEARDADDHASVLQTNYSDAFAFSDSERLALQLYDQLYELELQQSLVGAQQSGTFSQAHDFSALPDDLVEERLTMAQREAMEARAAYEMRNRITHKVLVMDPVLQAVHGGGGGGGGERTAAFAAKRILPLMAENDTVSMMHGAQTAKLASTMRALSAAEQANMVANRQNRELAQTMVALAEEMKAQSAQDIQDPQLRAQVDAVDQQLRASRRRAKTLQGVLAGMIVGSGINWAADEGLSELVMEGEGEEDC